MQRGPTTAEGLRPELHVERGMRRVLPDVYARKLLRWANGDVLRRVRPFVPVTGPPRLSSRPPQARRSRTPLAFEVRRAPADLAPFFDDFVFEGAPSVLFFAR